MNGGLELGENLTSARFQRKVAKFSFRAIKIVRVALFDIMLIMRRNLLFYNDYYIYS
jgi:hypothetical protein